MKVAIATAQVPFITGGAEILAASLRQALEARGVEADIVSIPFKWYPPGRVLDAMMSARLVDLSAVNGSPIERVITLKFPAYYVEHTCKVAWLLHQHRQAYDLFDTPYGDLHHDAEGASVAAEIRAWDTRLLPAHRALFTISRTVQARLAQYNNLPAEVLYHPPANAERYRCDDFEPFILAPGRIDPMKRQHLAIAAAAALPEGAKLVLIGASGSDYATAAAASAAALGDKVVLRGVVSEAEKLDLYARCLAVYNGVYDEDYGYLTLEAFLAGKPVIAHPDSGGPLEFVRDGENGLIAEATPEALGAVFRQLAADPALARRLGAAGRDFYDRLGVSWDAVVERLLA